MDIVKTCKTIKKYYVLIRNFVNPPPPPKPNVNNLSFTSFVLRVNTESAGWQKAIAAVLNSNQSVRSFDMDERGYVTVSGTVDLKLLMKMLKKAEKSTELVCVNSGQCSSNMTAADYVSNNYVGPNNRRTNWNATVRPVFRPQPSPPHYVGPHGVPQVFRPQASCGHDHHYHY